MLKRLLTSRSFPAEIKGLDRRYKRYKIRKENYCEKIGHQIRVQTSSIPPRDDIQESLDSTHVHRLFPFIPRVSLCCCVCSSFGNTFSIRKTIFPTERTNVINQIYLFSSDGKCSLNSFLKYTRTTERTRWRGRVGQAL